MVAFPYLDHPGVSAFAHRGGTSEHPENTIEAFQNAIDLGFRFIETDVHASVEGVLFAFHDDDLSRVTGRAQRIGDLGAREIDRIRFGGDYRIPRLSEVFDRWPNTYVNIDPKADAAVDPLIAEIRAHDAVDRVCVGSFSDRRIARCRSRLGPGLCTSMGPREAFRLWLAARGLPIGRVFSPCIQAPTHVDLPGLGRRVEVITPRLVDEAHDRDIKVHVWTIDDPDEMRRLIDMGVDGIMTDRPEVLRQVLESRQLWPGQAVGEAGTGQFGGRLPANPASTSAPSTSAPSTNSPAGESR